MGVGVVRGKIIGVRRKAYGVRQQSQLLELRSFSIEPLNPGPLGPFMVLPTLSEMIPIF